jgi:hypothetical protein
VTRVTVRSGYDPFYPLRGARDYYLDAARHGEEPGVWFGGGLEALGLHEGQNVETTTYKTVYCEQNNPLTGEHLGRRRTAVTYEQHLARLMSREPHATAMVLAQARDQSGVYRFPFNIKYRVDRGVTQRLLLARRKGGLP